jgi:hypothetical protein
MGNVFKVWRADNEEDDAGSVPRGATFYGGQVLDAEDAAKAWVNNRWSDMSYPDEVAVNVRAPDGTLTRWTVTVEMVPRFTARPAKTGDV